MGWNVIAFGQIDVDEKYHDVVLKKLKELHTSDSAIVRIDEQYLDFEMSGNKGVPYGSLDILKEWAIEKGINITISTSEYSEVGSGYYFDYDEYEAEEELDEKRMSD